MSEEKREVVREALEAVPFFPPLKEEEKAQLAEQFQVVEYPKGTVIFEQGDPGDFLYVLQRGSVEVYVGKGETKKVLASLQPKELFGEMALVTGEPRSASVAAREDCCVVALKRSDFEKLLASNPALAVNLTKVISRRLMHAAKAPEEVVARKSEVLTIYSATGRCGKTALAISLSALLAQAKKNVLLLDFNFQFGHVGLAINSKPELTIYNLVQKTIDADLLSQHVKKTEYGFSVLFAPLHIAEAEVIAEQKIIETIATAKELFDVLIIDTECTVSSSTLGGLDHATKILYLYEPDMFSLRDAKECLEVMHSLEYPTEKIMLIKREKTTGTAELSDRQVEEFLGHKIAAVIPHDLQVLQSFEKGKLLVLDNPKAPYAQAIARLLNQLEGKGANGTEEKAGKGLMGKFFGKK